MLICIALAEDIATTTSQLDLHTKILCILVGQLFGFDCDGLAVRIEKSFIASSRGPV
jgi:hypothetical protein